MLSKGKQCGLWFPRNYHMENNNACKMMILSKKCNTPSFLMSHLYWEAEAWCPQLPLSCFLSFWEELK